MNTEKHPNYLLFEQIVGNSKDLVDFMRYTALSPSPSSSIFTEIRSKISEPVFLRRDQLSMSQKAEIADALFQSLVVWLEKTRTKEELQAFPKEWQNLLAKGLADALLLPSSSLSNMLSSEELLKPTSMPAFAARGQLQEIAKLIDSWIGQSDPRKPVISPDGTAIIAPGRLPDDDFISQTAESMVRSIRTYNELRLNKDNPHSDQEARIQALSELAMSIIHQVGKFFHDRDNNIELTETELENQKKLLINALSELRTLNKLIREDSASDNSNVASRISSTISQLETYLNPEA